MADKSVNVKIQYNVDSSQVQKSEQLLKQAQAAANQFQASAQKSGKATSTEFSTANKSILSMQLSLARLKTQIEVASDPKAVKRLSAEYQRLKTQLDAATKSAFQLPKALNETGKATQSLASQFGNLYTAAKLFVTAGVVKEAVDITLAMAKLAGNVEGVTRAFNRAFPNQVKLLDDLRQATHGTVNDFELMQRTLQATNLGVAVEQLPILFEFAAARAQQTGESVDYLVDSIVRGIGRKSILVLDNLGLSATRLREQFNGASLASQSVADVTKGVAEIARIELQKMGGYAETSATAVDQLTAAIVNFKAEAAKQFESKGIIQFFNELVTGVTNYIKGNKQFLVEQARAIAAQDAARLLESKAFKDLGDNQQAKIDFIQQEANSRVQLIGRYNDNINALKEERELLRDKNPYDSRIESINNQIKALNANKVVLASTILILKDYIVEFQKANEVEKESLGLIESLKIKIDGLNESIEKAKTPEMIEALNKELFVTQAQLQELLDLGRNTFRGLSKEFIDARLRLIEFNQAFRDAAQANPSDTQFQTGTAKDLTVPTSESLSNDTVNIIKGIAKKQGEEFNKALGESVDISSEMERAWFEAKDSLIQGGIDMFADQLFSMEAVELASLENRLNNLRNFYDEQMILAGDNERAKAELRLNEERETARLQKKMAEKERQVRKFSIIIDTAASIAKTAAQLGFPAAIPFIALAAAQGASQLAIVNRTPARFAKGGLNIKGPGTGTSDSIDAKISKGESVMTAQEWKTSKNVLKEVRAKTLDDKVLSDLKLTREGVKYVGMDDKRIIGKLEEIKNSFPDIEERSGLVYKTRKKSDTYRQWIRKSSMSN